MTKAIDREVQARNNRVMRNKLYGKTVDVGAWKYHKESWKENLERYRKERQELNNNAEVYSNTKRFNPVDVNKMKLISNNMDICRLNIDICDNQIKIAELQQQNTKLKTKM
jgi:hypothetical protein